MKRENKMELLKDMINRIEPKDVDVLDYQYVYMDDSITNAMQTIINRTNEENHYFDTKGTSVIHLCMMSAFNLGLNLGKRYERMLKVRPHKA